MASRRVGPQLPICLSVLNTAAGVLALVSSLAGLNWYSSAFSTSPSTFMLTCTASVSLKSFCFNWQLQAATQPSWAAAACIPVTSPYNTVNVPLDAAVVTTLRTDVSSDSVVYITDVGDYAFAAGVAVTAAGSACLLAAVAYAAMTVPAFKSANVIRIARATTVVASVVLLAGLVVFIMGLTWASQNLNTSVSGTVYALFPWDATCIGPGMSLTIAATACCMMAAAASMCCVSEQDATVGSDGGPKHPALQHDHDDALLTSPLLPSAPPALSIQSAMVQPYAGPPPAARMQPQAGPAFCTACGALRAPRARFCAYCGMNLWVDATGGASAAASAAAYAGYVPPMVR